MYFRSLVLYDIIAQFIILDLQGRRCAYVSPSYEPLSQSSQIKTCSEFVTNSNTSIEVSPQQCYDDQISRLRIATNSPTNTILH